MVDDYKSRIEEAVRPEDLTKTSENLTGTYAFFSFDLVNSTYFKNKESSWIEVFTSFYNACKNKVEDGFERARLWKMVGDEIIFYMPILDESEIYNAPNIISSIMNDLIELINKEYDKTKGIIFVKSVLWAAFVNDNEFKFNSSERVNNIVIKEPVYDNINLDFLGTDIDIGFRISKFTLQSKLVIDAKLACLLTKLETELEMNNISDYMRIVTYEKLKGVWDGRYYPIVWYQKHWDSTNNMFLYDEQFNSDIVKKIVESGMKSLLPVSRLTKVFSDLNKFDEIIILRKGIEIYKSEHPKGFIAKKVSYDRLSEIHLVAICFNENNEILISKRVEKADLAKKWEFGCSQLKINQSFADSMKEAYLKDFGLQLEFLEDEPQVIGQYKLTKSKEENRIVPGLIFVAKVTLASLKNDITKHSETRWVNIESANEIKPEEAVPNFHERIKNAYEYIGKTSSSSSQ